MPIAGEAPFVLEGLVDESELLGFSAPLDVGVDPEGAELAVGGIENVDGAPELAPLELDDVDWVTTKSLDWARMVLSSVALCTRLTW